MSCPLEQARSAPLHRAENVQSRKRDRGANYTQEKGTPGRGCWAERAQCCPDRCSDLTSCCVSVAHSAF